LRQARFGRAVVTQVGPFATKDQATTFRDSLKAAGGSCLVLRGGAAGGQVAPNERRS
jgi:hypothetical protein